MCQLNCITDDEKKNKFNPANRHKYITKCFDCSLFFLFVYVQLLAAHKTPI